MLLNITRSQGMTPEAILKKSFKQFQVGPGLLLWWWWPSTLTHPWVHHMPQSHSLI
jgi:hypothetical protein